MRPAHLTLASLLALLLICSLAAAGRSTLTPLDPRPVAPDFELSDYQGTIVRLQDFRGRVLVVNFWASWCPPCLEEMPSLEQGARWLARYDGHFIAINYGERPETVLRFLETMPLDIDILLDPEAETAVLWGVEALPVSFVIDTEGRIAYIAKGARDWSDPALLVPVRALGLNRQ